jgi:8-oxo-dGTP diphosphatase
MKKYVLVFLFNESCEYVLLIRKQRPDWQRNKLNGLGGKVEDGETFAEAACREVFEEAGIKLVPDAWQPDFTITDGKTWECPVFSLKLPNELFESFGTKTDERVDEYLVKDVSALPTLPNVKWMIPLLLDVGLAENTLRGHQFIYMS